MEKSAEAKIEIQIKTKDYDSTKYLSIKDINEMRINLKEELNVFKEKAIDSTISVNSFSLSKVIIVRFPNTYKFYPLKYQEAKDLLEVLDSYIKLEESK